jgi:ribonuclease P protein component
MQPPHRLRSRQDFERVRQRGRGARNGLLILQAARNDLQVTRCGLSVSRRLGTAVARNRVRRRLREILRHAMPNLGTGWDLVLVARPPAAEASFGALRQAALDALGRAQVLRPPAGREAPPVPVASTSAAGRG